VRSASLVLLVLTSLAAPLAVAAQPPERPDRIGMLERTSATVNAANLDGFRRGLRDVIVYGVNYPEHYRRAASFVDRIFRGAPPSDLPIEQPTKFDRVIDLRAARAAGLRTPPPLVRRADQVVE
jgi:hypothetical protein